MDHPDSGGSMSKKIAVLITDDFEDSEFTSPAEAFKLAGHQVITIEKQAGKTVKGKQGEAEVAIDRAIDDVTPGGVKKRYDRHRWSGAQCGR
ncbi:DJ-1/PfpI family protein, partial [Klebsiella pneumoniae]|uniref:DJ-1/PfpI family protein n=2 Tax=Klebsiella pneumoniae TaxID=573 RepID=UPI00396948C0